MMHGPEKSDLAIVAGKPANKAEQSAAESVERRAGTKGNARQQSTGRTQSRVSVSHALERGFDLMGLFYDIASYVQRLAAGAKPSDMPIEQSPRFYMGVNLKTAASLGISLSDVFIARANEVRE
jgi:hypothetical protein